MPQREAVPESLVQDALAIEYVSLGEILHWPSNPKDHDIGAIAASIEAFGFRDPVGVNRRTQEIEEGHGRIDTLRAMYDQGRPAPEFIRVDEGEWLVPVLFFDDEPTRAHAYALAHNKTQELGGPYDEDKLLEALREQEDGDLLLATGFDHDDVDALRRKLEDDAVEPVVDESYQILVTCRNQDERSELMERLAEEGVTCREV